VCGRPWLQSEQVSSPRMQVGSTKHNDGAATDPAMARAGPAASLLLLLLLLLRYSAKATRELMARTRAVPVPPYGPPGTTSWAQLQWPQRRQWNANPRKRKPKDAMAEWAGRAGAAGAGAGAGLAVMEGNVGGSEGLVKTQIFVVRAY
jgi:hypothetical protein